MILFLSKCKALGRIIQFILFCFQYYLSTNSHFSFSSFEWIAIILENHFVIFNPIQRLHKKMLPTRSHIFCYAAEGFPSIYTAVLRTLINGGKRKNIACDVFTPILLFQTSDISQIIQNTIFYFFLYQ